VNLAFSKIMNLGFRAGVLAFCVGGSSGRSILDGPNSYYWRLRRVEAGGQPQLEVFQGP
jgi:hypothetical protein